MDDRFVNPYTFVPLPKGGAKRSDCTAVTEPVFSGEAYHNNADSRAGYSE